MVRVDARPEAGGREVPQPGQWTRERREAFAARLDRISGMGLELPQGKVLPVPEPGKWTVEHREAFAERLERVARRTQAYIRIY